MKMDVKRRVMVFLLVVIIVSLNSISYGTVMTGPAGIDRRGITFNTGTSSDQIRLLKSFFRARNEDNVPWGYAYDERTKELVRNYQKLRGIKADGIASQATIDLINQEIVNRNLKIGLRTISTDISGDMIVINKSSNTLYFLKDGVVQETYPVATGKTTNLTPNGKFKVVVKFINPSWGGAGVSAPIAGGAPNNPLGKRWIGISYGGGSRYGVHGNSNPKSIGTYASLGCVRMFNEDVEKLYKKVNINTPVWIGPEETLIGYGVEFKSNYVESQIAKEENIKEEEINITIGGNKLTLQDPVINKYGTIYYPFREILELVGAEVSWDNENKRAKGILGENYVEFQLDNNEYIENDKYRFLPEGQKIFTNRGKTYIPIRNLMEGLGYDVDWEESSRTLTINEKPWEVGEN